MDENQKSDKEKQQSSDNSGNKAATPTAPVPTPPQSSQSTPAPKDAETATEARVDAAPANQNIHEYREIADGVQARVRTDEERAADAPSKADVEGIEITTARG